LPSIQDSSNYIIFLKYCNNKNNFESFVVQVLHFKKQ
jgi:hypothetical protein